MLRTVLLLAITISVASQLLPIQPNMAVATCREDFPDDFIIGIIDIRNPQCLAPPVSNSTTIAPANWMPPMSHNEMPNPTNNPGHEWRRSNFKDQLFGIALDDAANPNIYATATSCYGSQASGNIYRLDGTTGAISILTTLPNTGPGLGNVCFNSRSQHLYVTNMEDGKIYRVNPSSGVTVSTFDPFGPDNGTAGFVDRSQRIWGIQYNYQDDRLYFGTWSEDGNHLGSPNRVYSVELDASGNFIGSEVLEITVPSFAIGPSQVTQPISDITFTASGDLILAERSMVDDTATAAHRSRVLRFTGGHLLWVSAATQYEVGKLGAVGERRNAAGGVAVTDCVDIDDCNPYPTVLATSDAIDIGATNIYGIQMMPVSGGTLGNSWAIDLDGDTASQDKTDLGDVEVFRRCIDRIERKCQENTEFGKAVSGYSCISAEDACCKATQRAMEEANAKACTGKCDCKEHAGGLCLFDARRASCTVGAHGPIDPTTVPAGINITCPNGETMYQCCTMCRRMYCQCAHPRMNFQEFSFQPIR